MSTNSTNSQLSRKNRVKQMLIQPSTNYKRRYNINTLKNLAKTSGETEVPFWTKITNTFLRSNTKRLPATMKVTKGGRRLTEYEQRALRELSYRSPQVVKSNLKLTNKGERRRLTQVLNSTRKNKTSH